TNPRVRFLLSTDMLVDSTDHELGDATYPGAIPPGLSVNVVGTFTAPVDLPPGRYHLLTVADPDEALVEVSRENNEGSAFALGLAPRAPDFVVTRLLGSANASVDRPYLVTRTIRNQ